MPTCHLCTESCCNLRLQQGRQPPPPPQTHTPLAETHTNTRLLACKACFKPPTPPSQSHPPATTALNTAAISGFSSADRKQLIPPITNTLGARSSHRQQHSPHTNNLVPHPPATTALNTDAILGFSSADRLRKPSSPLSCHTHGRYPCKRIIASHSCPSPPPPTHTTTTRAAPTCHHCTEYSCHLRLQQSRQTHEAIEP